MIYEALQLLRAELAAYLNDPDRDENARVELGSAASGKDEQVLLSLVNVEEESALRNSSPYQRNALGGFDLVNPPVYLNLYVLVTVCSTDNNTYETALKRLAWVVQCFQQQNGLSASGAGANELGDAPGLGRLRVSVDLHPLSFERANQLWGILGGRQSPCVLYKVRVVEERGAAKAGQSAEIVRIQNNYASGASAN